MTAASGSLKDTFFVCPPVSTHNPSRTASWVIGFHGTYYVLIPTQGSGSGVRRPQSTSSGGRRPGSVPER